MKESIDVENFERLVPWGMKMRLECENIEFVENKEDDEIIVYQVMNETIFACHGHKEKMGSVISDLVKLLKIFPNEVHLGHFHRHSTLEDNDMELIINGSFSGTDEYAKSIRKSNKPSQTLIIYNEKGQECLYKITL
jgi:predicted phosphodiesterase